MSWNEAKAALAALQARERTKQAIEAELFDRQIAVHYDKAQFRALHPGRRGGKSQYVSRGASLRVLDARPNSVVLIGAETQKKAIALQWANVAWLKQRHRIALEPNMQMGRWTTPWGAAIQFWGFNDRNAVDLLRGFDVDSAFFDEVATYDSELKYLVRDVMEPALSESGGPLTLMGTPSLTRAGHWFDICCTKRLGTWSVHHWTLLDNPMFRGDARVALAKALANLGGDPENATFQREWMGRFVNDPESQVYAYLASRNDVAALPPHYDRRTWWHVVAIDFGVVNDCAWSVLGMHPTERRAYVLGSQKQRNLLTDQAAEITAQLCSEYEPIKVVGDAGGLGKPYVDEWNRRYAGLTVDELRRKARVDGSYLTNARSQGYPMPSMHPADKLGKRAHIDFVNTELRAPRVFFVQPYCEPLTSELLSLPWHRDAHRDPRLKEAPGHPNHCADTFLYGLTELRPYLNDAPAPRVDPSVITPDVDAWMIEQEIRALRGDPEPY